MFHKGLDEGYIEVFGCLADGLDKLVVFGACRV